MDEYQAGTTSQQVANSELEPVTLRKRIVQIQEASVFSERNLPVSSCFI